MAASPFIVVRMLIWKLLLDVDWTATRTLADRTRIRASRVAAGEHGLSCDHARSSQDRCRAARRSRSPDERPIMADLRAADAAARARPTRMQDTLARLSAGRRGSRGDL